ncbi:hypothetical protein SAMN05216327_1203 [Dyadobacter sp. SG02]|uniref:hypothetical protein n=1 Tax=Dyadobacter sp. SG02 TaxID=1855291 RepID=UPI0008C715A1|nr:hypothetical protein [Dyadobacter sp. SG02]SEJ78761.1 hypothetical protein SAMN05216327_1203 [Dyadobacter sp. SG02]
MEIEDLRNEISNQIREQQKNTPSPKAIEIVLKSLPLVKVDLSLILWQQIGQEKIEFDNEGKPLTTIYLIIQADFEEIQVDDRLKCFMVLENVKGNTLTIGDPSYGFHEKKINLDLHINGGEIANVKISIPLNRVTVNSTYCALFDITFLVPTQSIHKLYIRANIKKISFKFAQIDSAEIYNEGEKDSQNVIDLYLLQCEIPIFSYQTHHSLTLNCFRSTFSKRFFLLSKGNAGDTKIVHNRFGELIIKLESQSAGIIVLNKNDIKMLNLSGQAERVITSMKGLELRDMSLSKDFIGKVENLEIVDGIVMSQFINRGEMSFHAVDTQKCPLVIEDSILGKTLFVNCTIPESIRFSNSSIFETQFFNSATPMIVESIDGLDPATLTNNQSDAFRQLKIAANKEGNRELANYYRSKELTAHYKGTSFLKRPAEKISLFLNFSNNHGMSWLKPLMLIFIIIGPLMYGWFLSTLSYELDFSSSSSWSAAGQLWSHYLEFIIPGYLYPSKTKFIFLGEVLGLEDFDISVLSLYSRCLIYLNDIVVMPYLIIQMITAFRRHVKSE